MKNEICEIKQVQDGNTTEPANKNQLLRWFFTFNNFTEIELKELIYFLENNSNVDKYVCQEEIGNKCGTKHIQGSLWLKRKARYTEFKLSKRIHWELLRNEDASYDYCKKHDTSTGRRWTNIEKYLNKFERVGAIQEHQLYSWQVELEQIYLTEPDDRKVYWTWKEEGCKGKSAWCKYMLVKYKDEIIFLDGGKKSDLINIIYNFKTDKLRAVIFDLTRAKKGAISTDTIESIKNGIICNTKFETGFKIFKSPHIFVFSNSYPKNYEDLSEDRWVIKSL